MRKLPDSEIDTSMEESQVDAAERRAKGEFVRGVSGFRGQLGDGDFPAEPDRYHLYVAFNCPWSHRASLARNVLGLEESITMDVAFPGRTDEDDPVAANRWEFNPARIASLTGTTLPECTYDTATGQKYRLVTGIYEQNGSGERSVPILYDKKTHCIVTNESADIVRMLNAHAGDLGSSIVDDKRFDLYPDGDENSELRDQIDLLNEDIYTNINNGAYKAGFSSSQAVYMQAFEAYFKQLEALENLMSDGRPFLTGDHFTEADLRLFPTLYRHDPIYYVRMKLNGAKILDYPNLWRWLCRTYALPGVKASNSLVHCRQGYFGRSWNNVVPLGPFKPIPYPQAYDHPELARDY